ncbi:transposase [Emticicia agri]|uniref:Transposase IS701-like DDE domain-containing protein n=1 Tax=Emticicia agri TaxID=2492393 RepID=A0A4Q5M0C1_9BACT|nr:hypothetical protein EWM59_13235 [Emticicia agri]
MSLSKGKPYLLAADETVKTKSGKKTYGIGLFYSSIANQVIPSISFLAISIIDIASETSYIIGVKQLLNDPKAEASAKKNKLSKALAKIQVSKLKGRPKGSKNKAKSESQGASYQVLKTFLALVCSQLKVLLPDLQCFHLVLDGFYGHESYLLLALDNSLLIISKFKSNAHPILPYLHRKT